MMAHTGIPNGLRRASARPGRLGSSSTYCAINFASLGAIVPSRGDLASALISPPPSFAAATTLPLKSLAETCGHRYTGHQVRAAPPQLLLARHLGSHHAGKSSDLRM